MISRLKPRERWKRWVAIQAPRGPFWFFFSAAIFFNLGFSIFVFLFNLYLLDFGRNERFLGLVGSCTAIGGILGTIPAGIFASRFGLRSTLTASILLAAIFCALRTCILWGPAQLILAVLTGLTLCTWAVCLSPAVAALTTEQERPAAFSLMFGSGIGVAGLGAFVAGRLPGWLGKLPLHTPLSSTRAVACALLIACVLAALAAFPLSQLKLRSSSPRAQLPRFSNPFLRRFLPAMAIWGLVTGSFAPFASVYFVHHIGLSLKSMGSVLSFSQFIQFVAILAAPLLFRRTGLASGIMLTQLATAATLVWLAASHTPLSVELVYWAYMAVQCMNEPGIYSLLMERVPTDERNGASASSFFISAISQAIAAAAMGAAIVRFGYSSSLLVLALLAVVAAILFRRLPAGLAYESSHS
jgi:MFS family permease